MGSVRFERGVAVLADETHSPPTRGRMGSVRSVRGQAVLAVLAGEIWLFERKEIVYLEIGFV